MKNLKFLLPMLAIIFAIGVAFTSPEHTEEPTVESFDYILVNGSWRSIAEQSCEGEGYDCTVQLGQNGQIYPVYDEMNTGTLKESGTENPTIINP